MDFTLLAMMPCLRIVHLIFYLLPLALFAQKSTVTGLVIDDQGLGISGATVLVVQSNQVGRTDTEGFYQIRNVPKGNYKIVCLASGKRMAEIWVEVDSLKEEVQFKMEALKADLNAVEIMQQSEEQFGLTRLRSVHDFAIYEGKKSEVVLLSEQKANLATNNPRQVYSRVTGLNIWESDGAGLQLGIGGRGLNPNRTASFNVRQNGYDISADALGYPESYYTPPTEALESIEIVRGAASLQYGTQFGGMLNFRFKRGALHTPFELVSRQTVGSWGFFNSFNSVGGTTLKGKLNYYGFFQYKRGDGSFRLM